MASESLLSHGAVMMAIGSSPTSGASYNDLHVKRVKILRPHRSYYAMVTCGVVLGAE
jgi:hypothetical protein